MLHAIIMAGGSGTRFWPASRSDCPKQLLALVGAKSMLQQTVIRVAGFAPPEQIMVVTSGSLTAAVRRELDDWRNVKVVGEPCKRDTAPCIGLAALLISRADPAGTMVVMPADHVISDQQAFAAAIDAADQIVGSRDGCLVTFGIKPTYPAESFGYIQRAERLNETIAGDIAAFRVGQFREKPDAETAARYVAAGDFYWNSGIFVWKAETILAALRQRQPEMLARLTTIVEAWDTPQADEVFATEFARIEGISIDYAVMEHATDVAMIEAPFDWDDVGSWQALHRLAGTDENGNTLIGRNLAIGTTDSIVRTDDDHLVVALGMKDCIVVHTPNATLVADKHREEEVRQVVKQLTEKAWHEYL